MSKGLFFPYTKGKREAVQGNEWMEELVLIPITEKQALGGMEIKIV